MPRKLFLSALIGLASFAVHADFGTNPQSFGSSPNCVTMQKPEGKESMSANSFAGKSGFEVVFSGKMLFEAPFGENQNQESFLFSGAGFSKLFQKNITAFDTYDANSMFLLSSSRFGVTATRQINDWKISLVGLFNLNQGAGARGNVREAYILLDNPLLGTLALGNVPGVEDVTAMGAFDITQGSGGVVGTSFSKFIAPTTGVLTYPSMAGDTLSATKVRYITPRVPNGLLKGIQLAASFTPNTMHRGESPLNTGSSPLREPFVPFDLNSLALGVNYLAQWNTGSFGVSFVRIQGNTRPEKPLLAQAGTPEMTDPVTNKVIDAGTPALTGDELDRSPTRAYQVGGVLTLGPVSFGAEYVYNGKSHTLENDFDPTILDKDGNVVKTGINPGTITFNGQEVTFDPKQYIANQAGQGKILTLSMAYIGENYGVSFSFLQSSVKTGFIGENQTTSNKATCRGYVISTQYNAIPGLVPYLELGTFKLTNLDWAYTSTMIPALTQFDFSGVPGKDTFTNAAIIGLKVQF